MIKFGNYVEGAKMARLMLNTAEDYCNRDKHDKALRMMIRAAKELLTAVNNLAWGMLKGTQRKARRQGMVARNGRLRPPAAALLACLILAAPSVAGAWTTDKNPDRYPSIGWGLHGGELPAIAKENARFTEFGVDFRMPVSNYLSLTVDWAQTTVSNASLGVPTEANRFGAQMRVYLGNFN